MSSRSERYLANADKCQQCADAAYTPGTKRLYGVLASQWRQLAEEPDWTDQIGSPRLLEEIRHADGALAEEKARKADERFAAETLGSGSLSITPRSGRLRGATEV